MSVVQVEHILVVPTESFHALGYFEGVTTEVDRYLGELLKPENVSYRPRPDMEDDPSFKQLIPYVIFEYTDAAGNKSIFQYTRGKGQGEARLHSKRSIGIGGHISSEDAGDHLTGNPYEEGMQRELAEEVVIDTAYDLKCVGMLNDDSNDVGKVHLGIVHICKVEEPKVTANETEIADAGFQPVEKLLEEIEQFETWSSICLKALYGN
ncbi:MAG: phosphoesterase [Blastopirellula sp.]|nr:MAG: phosphoesterase [Blastopirellula sp.]